MTSHEFTDQTQLPTPEAILADPNLLMQPAVLDATLHASHELLPAELKDSYHIPAETQQAADKVQEMAMHSVVRPEKAAQAAERFGRSTAETLSDDVQQVDDRLKTALNSGETAQLTVAKFTDGSQLAGVAVQIGMLREMLDQPRVLTQSQDWRVPYGALKSFAEAYVDGKAQADGQYGDALQDANSVVVAVEQMKDDSKHSVTTLYDTVRHELQYGTDDATTVGDVVARGAATVNDHVEATRVAAETVHQQMSEASQQTASSFDAANTLTTTLRSAMEGLDQMPHVTHVRDAVDTIERSINVVIQSNAEAGTGIHARQSLDELERMLLKIRDTARTTTTAANAYKGSINQLQTAVTTLRETAFINDLR